MRRPPLRAAFARFVLAAPLPVVGAISLAAQTPRFELPATTCDYGIRSPYTAADLGPRWHHPREADPRSDHLATLGRVLFYDRALSRNRSRSCASCHEQARAFSDGRARSRGFLGRSTKRNSMSLSNLRLREGGFFWDDRVERLEDMVLLPIQDPIEMGLDLGTLVERLREAESYEPLFRQAFGDPAIDAERIGSALATFVRAIVSLRSRYDAGLAVAGNATADFADFTAEENRGKQLFFRSCASCHAAPLPSNCGSCRPCDPRHLEGSEFVNNGIDGGQRGDDPGRGGITGSAEDRGRFRAPTLRNIELTAPYMHDGRFATLEDVLQFYAHRVRPHPTLDGRMRGGGDSSDTPGSWGQPASSALPVITTPLGLPLDARERADLVAFLKTLTDHELTRDPRYSDPFVPPARNALARAR